MKKLIFATMLSLGSLTAFAQDTETDKEQEDMETPATEVVAEAQDNFSEIAIEELPEAVVSAVEKNYPTATINSAYVNEEKHFKLEVSLQDGTAGTLYADEDGNWIEQ